MTAHTEKDLLSKLHLKFTALICGVAALILAVSFAYIAWSNQNQRIASVYVELNAALETVVTKGPRDLDPPAEGAKPPRIGDKKEVSWPFPIALYIARENDGEISSVININRFSTAIVDDETLQTILESTFFSPDEQGFLADEGLFYKKITRDDGSVCYAFADRGIVDDAANLNRSLIMVGIAIMLLVLALAWAFSRWALRPVQRAWDSQQQFIADASHEMKTPLTVIMANASIALKKPQATIAEQSQWIEGIQDEAQNMEHLVLDMLALAQPENAVAQAATTEHVNMSEMAERASLQFEAVAFERGVMINDDIDSDMMVVGDPTKLQRLIGTLVDNACKYAERDTSITVSLKAAGRNCVLSVHNWGCPIDPQDIPHVFDRFYRSDKSRDRSNNDGEHSFGLGLAIAQKIVQQHGGELSVTSSAEDGTTFTARLPRAEG